MNQGCCNRRRRTGFPILVGIVFLGTAWLEVRAGSRPLQGYIRELAPEPAAHAVARHEKVAERRSGPIIIVHRGASAFAPENTLEAYAAAMDYGADGCELDIRRTADGVLVLFHDDMLDHLTDGFGSVSQLTCYELLELNPRFIYGTADRATRPPTFAALLALARQRAMLLHLDVKEPNLEDDIIRLLDAADVWDHVVSVNNYNADKLLKQPRLKTLAYKAPGLSERRRDMDPVAIRDALSRPGNLIMVDDPRVAAHELKRPAYQPLPLPKDLRVIEQPAHAAGEAAAAFNAVAFVKAFDHRFSALAGPRAGTAEKLLAILQADFPERDQPEGDADYQRRRTGQILERAWAAQRLGVKRHRTPGLEKALAEQVLRRTLHRDWTIHGLDGAMAARALARRGATASAPVLVAAFRRVDPELSRVANPEWKQYPLAWTDAHFKMHLLPALGELRCAASKRLLLEYLAMDDAEARALSPPMFEEATPAALRQDLTRTELAALLRSTNSAVRGTVILECLDHPTRARNAALKTVAPWALELPRAKR